MKFWIDALALVLGALLWLQAGAAHAQTQPAPGPTPPEPVRFHVGLDTGVLVLDTRALFAAQAHVSAELYNQLSLRVAVLATGGSTTDGGPQPSQRAESLLGVRATLGYRIHIPVDDTFTLTITPEIGAIVGLQTITRTSLLTRAEDTIELAITRPTVGLRFGLGDFIELGYELQLDVERPEASGHLMTFGFRL